MVKICITGCLHGNLDKVYADIAAAEKAGQFKCDLVLCCGDFQSVRNPADLASMSVPQKYNVMGDFWRYYAEQCTAPILTLFIGGNHESSGYLQELPYGGWVAPNIWYMGYAGVVQFGGLRIAGLSGIYKQHDYTMGHFERPPYSESTKRSVYHLRNVEVFRLGQIRRPLDVVLSHDWPRGIYHYGDTRELIRKKPFFAEEIRSDALGSPPAEQLLCRVRPRYWFSAHLHCSFAAVVEFSDTPPDQPQLTRFLALDKCLPRRDYLRFVDIEPQQHSADGSLFLVNQQRSNEAAAEQQGEERTGESSGLCLDPEWLCILRSTNQFMSTSQVPCILPGRNAHENCDFSATDADIQSLYDLFGGDFTVPDNFERTATAYKPDSNNEQLRKDAAASKPRIFSNPQTELLCAMLDLINPNALLLGRESYSLNELRKREDDDADDVEEQQQSVEQLQSDDSPSGRQPSETGSWLAPADTTSEYDPLDSVCMTTSGEQAVSHNPEELNLDDIDDEDDDSRHEEPAETQHQTVDYSPSTAAVDEAAGCYSPTTTRVVPDSSGNAEEIPLSDASDDDDDASEERTG